MKIGLVIYGALDTLSGGYLYDRMLVRTLRANGCQVDLLSLPWRNYGAHLTDNLRWRWVQSIVEAGYDLILQDELNHPSLFLANRLLRRQTRAPVVSIVHHLRSEENHPQLPKALYRVVENAYLRTVNGFIFNSRTSRRLVEGRVGTSRTGIVAYPAADHIGPPSANDISARLEERRRSTDPLRVLFVGNLAPRKGLHLVLDAFARLSTQPCALDVVGSPSVDPVYAARLQAQAAALPPVHSIAWHGRVDDATLSRLYWNADLLVVPSYEGFGIVYLEAMAFGLPVIASTHGAAHELITPGVNGYLLPPGASEQLAGYLTHYSKRRPLITEHGAHARRVYDSFGSWEQTMKLACRWLHEITNKAK